jgi:UDP-N-acetylmuramate--alanine ligase
MGKFDAESKYFIYEADEFDRNFLAYEPHISLITGVSWDHQEIFPTREDYQDAFLEFISQSEKTLIWEEDADYLKVPDYEQTIEVLSSSNTVIESITVKGKYNRLDAFLSISAVAEITSEPIDKLIQIMNSFPGLSRRMEEIIPNLYSDYAHTPEKIRGCMSVALEITQGTGQSIVVIYEPLTNRRQHYMISSYTDCFNGAEKVYWLPSYLAREDKTQRIISPEELISHLDDPEIAEPAKRDENLKHIIQSYLDKGEMVVGMAGGGGDSLDDWLRKEFK